MTGILSVLHVSTADNVGGSGRSAWRVHTGLKRLGVRSRMLVGRKFSDDPDVQLVSEGWVERADDVCGRVADRLGLQYFFYPSSVGLPRRQWVREADVVQLYNTHGGYLSHTILPRLSRRAPVVWRLSDMWAMTGHCGYAYDCDRWKRGCGACPRLDEYPALRLDTTRLLWRAKREIYRRTRMVVVAPSQWIADLCRESPLLRQFRVAVIRNGVDTETFKPRRRAEAREALGLGGAERVVLFSANVSDPRKGADVLARALAQLTGAERRVMTMLVVGSHACRWEAPPGVRVRRVELVQNDELMATIYSASDVAVLPTLADTLPNGVLESMACGTPNVTFRIGGIPEVVRHMETGYLADSHDAGDLVRGIQLLLADSKRLEAMRERCRMAIETDHSQTAEVGRYLDLYRSLVGDRVGARTPLAVEVR